MYRDRVFSRREIGHAELKYFILDPDQFFVWDISPVGFQRQKLQPGIVHDLAAHLDARPAYQILHREAYHGSGRALGGLDLDDFRSAGRQAKPENQGGCLDSR